MKDLRQIGNSSQSLHGTKISGYESGEKKVKEMLAFLNVADDEETVEEAVGYLSSRAMEFTVSNLNNFLKTKTAKSRIDLRK